MHNGTKYTPGPWTRYGTNVAAICGPLGDMVIAECYGPRGLSNTERIANANLIAAAPDMAEALNGLLASVDVQRLYGIGLLKAEWKRGMDALQKAGL